MAFGIKYVPITPGVCPSSEPMTTFPDLYTMLPKWTEEQVFNIKKSLHALICDIEAERERDLAITSPTRPLFYMPPTQPRPPLHVANYDPPTPSTPADDAGLDFGFLAGHDDFSLPDDMECDLANNAEYRAQLDQLIAETFPGMPENVDWSPFPELDHLFSISSSPEGFAPSLDLPECIPECIDDSLLDDESFRKSFEEFAAVFPDSLSHSSLNTTSSAMDEA